MFYAAYTIRNFTLITAHVTMSENKDEETRPSLAAAARRLGTGYRGRGGGTRRPTREPDQEPAVPVAAAAVAPAAAVADPPVVAAAAAAPSAAGEDIAKDSALKQLEKGLEAAANGPPHKVGDAGVDGKSKLHTAFSSCPSLDSEDVVAFTMD